MKLKLILFFILLGFGPVQLWAAGVLSWPAKEGAVEYQGEIASKKDFKQILLKFQSTTNEFELPEGDWGEEIFFRIRYVDQWKRLSAYSNTARISIERPAPPVPEVQVALPLKGYDHLFFGILPSQTFSKINSEQATQTLPLVIHAGAQKMYQETLHLAGVSVFPFQNDMKGQLVSVDYKNSKLAEKIFWGPALDFLYFNVVYKDKAEIAGADLLLGGQWGWSNSSASHPWLIRFEGFGSYDLKGYGLKSEITKTLYRGAKYDVSTGLKARHFDYQSGPHYTFSSFGLHLTLEKP